MRRLWHWIPAGLAVACWLLATYPLATSYRSIHPEDTIYGIAIFAAPPVLLGSGMLLYALLSRRRLWVLGSSGAAILVLTGCFTCSAVSNFYATEASRRAERVSLTRMHLLGVVLLLYAEDHSGRLPQASRWVDAVQPYIKDRRVFGCPSNPASGRVGYGFNASLSGKRLRDIRDPDRTVMVFEAASPGANPTGASDGAVWCVQREDGSADVITVSGNISVLTHDRRTMSTQPSAHW
jgi:hypothetical protein